MTGRLLDLSYEPPIRTGHLSRRDIYFNAHVQRGSHRPQSALKCCRGSDARSFLRPAHSLRADDCPASAYRDGLWPVLRRGCCEVPCFRFGSEYEHSGHFCCVNVTRVMPQKRHLPFRVQAWLPWNRIPYSGSTEASGTATLVCTVRQSGNQVVRPTLFGVLISAHAASGFLIFTQIARPRRLSPQKTAYFLKTRWTLSTMRVRFGSRRDDEALPSKGVQTSVRRTSTGERQPG